MRRASRSVALGVLVAMAGACAEELTPQSLVTDMRVLAIRAEPASAAPGGSVHLDALVVDPFGDERPISYFWAACLNPPADNPARCLQGTAPMILGDGAEADAPIPGDALLGRERGILGVLLYVCAGGTVSIGEDGVTCDGASTAQIAAVKRVPIEPLPDNRNPVIDQILLDGEAISEDYLASVASCAGACESHVLTLVASAESAESYRDGAQDRTEELLSSFAATSGQMDVPFGFGPSTEVEWTPPDSTGLVLFWFALRDDRGGVTWTERQALVQ